MTPDKVEAALGVASQMRDELMFAYSHEMAICNVECADEYLHRAQALSVLTEALAERGASAPTPCLWIQDLDDGSWDTGCGDKHQFTEGDICDNGHHFCPYCGGRIFETNEPIDDAAMKETP